MLLFAWLLPILTLIAALLLLAIAIALGGTAWPRWAALILNPIVPAAIASAASAVLPSPLADWFYAAAVNIVFLIIYATSTALLWNYPDARDPSKTHC